MTDELQGAILSKVPRGGVVVLILKNSEMKVL